MDKIKFKRFGVMVDCSRNAVPRVSYLKTIINDIHNMGYNFLSLYTEDTYVIDGEPYFGYLKGGYSADEIKEIVAYGKKVGIEIIPSIQTLAHFDQLFRWAPYKDINDCNDILLIDEDKTYELIDKMFKFVKDNYETDIVNIGMDEAHFVGLGKFLDKHGYQDRFTVLLRHLTKVCDIAKKYDLHPIMFSDMFFRLANKGEYYSDKIVDIPEEVKNEVPDNVSLIYWDYYCKTKEKVSAMMASHKLFNNEIWFAGGAWSWGGFTPSNMTSFETNSIDIPLCIENNIENVFICLWGDDGAETSKKALYPTLFYASCLARGLSDMNVIHSEFTKLFGISLEDYLKLDLPNQIEVKSTVFDFVGANADNPSKYMFYNDPFLGIYDSTVNNKVVKDNLYEKYGTELSKLTTNKEFGYLFETQEKLCKVLSIKYDLGVKTRKAYHKSKGEVRKIIPLYNEVIISIQDFYESFKIQWDKENKPFGFEVQDARIGGLVNRLKHCKERLLAYVDGLIPSIDELETEILPINNNPSKDGHTTYVNEYKKNVTGSNF